MLARRFLPCLLGISLCMRAAGELGKPGRARISQVPALWFFLLWMPNPWLSQASSVIGFECQGWGGLRGL